MKKYMEKEALIYKITCKEVSKLKKILSLAAAGLFTVGTASAGSITVANSDIEMSGGITGGYFYTTNSPANDYFTVTNFGIDLEAKTNSPITFKAGIGRTKQPTFFDPNPNATFGFEYGWVSLKPVEGLTIDAGKLLTNVGYELFHTYENKNYMFGLVWNAQPVVYPGARVSYDVMEETSVYAEYNQDGTGDAFAAGITGNLQGVDYALSYFDYSAWKNLIDVVLSVNIEGFEVGANFDYQWLDDTAKTPGNDDSAWGVAIYAGLDMDSIEIPVRIEYVDDGTSGIYGVNGDNAWTFTITPTYRPSKNTYIRAEVAYASTDKNTFVDKNGNPKDNRLSAGVEAGFLF